MSKDTSIQTLEGLLNQLSNGGVGGTRITSADEDVKYHENGEKFVAVPAGMSMEQVASLAQKKAAELNKVHSFVHYTSYRPNDGAYAAKNVIKKLFGLTIGKATQHMFGEDPPEFRNIYISYNEKVEVPFGELEIPALPGAVFHFHEDRGEYGPVFVIICNSPKKHKDAIEEFFAELDKELEKNSIYRGKALMGAYELKFMNVKAFKSNEIVFADHVQATVNASINTVIEHTAATKEAGLPTKRAVLAWGPYGTGKSSLGLITAQLAEDNGWTFLSARAGKDKLKPVFETAALYEPAVVFIEDIDTYTPSAQDKDGISEILDLFDGIASKSRDLMVVMTTNNIDKVPAGMLRPGRVDYTVEIAGLDRGGVERLIKRVVRNDLLDGQVDYDAVFAEMNDEWQPAWVRAVADRAQSFALSRSQGALDYTIRTEDLVSSAISLKPQLELMSKALEGFKKPELEVTFQDNVHQAVSLALDNYVLVDPRDNQQMAFSNDPQGQTWTPRAR